MSIKVEEPFKDAENLCEEAVKDLKANRIRKAAENAWSATLRVTKALILSKTGILPEYVPETRNMLEDLAIKCPEVEDLVGRFYEGDFSTWALLLFRHLSGRTREKEGYGNEEVHRGR